MALDGFGEKLKSFFKSKDDSKFKGQGHRLGTVEAVSSGRKPHHQPCITDGSRASCRPPLIDTNLPAYAAGNGAPMQPPPQPFGPGATQGGRPSVVTSRSHRTEDVVLDATVMANTPTGKEAQLVAGHNHAGMSHVGPGSPPSYPSSPPYMTSPPQATSPFLQTTGGGGGGAGGEGRRAGGGLTVDLPRSGGGGSGGGSGGQQGGATRLQSRGTSNLSSMVSTISTPTAAEKRIGGGFRCHAPPTDGAMADYGIALAIPEAYELQRCLALVVSCASATPSVAPPAAPSAAASTSAAPEPSSAPAPTGGPGGAPVAAAAAPPGGRCGPSTASARECCEALQRILRNVLTKPAETKYRQIRLSNPRVQETVVGVPGAVEFLEAAGFKMEFAPDDGSENANQGFLVLPDEVAPSSLAEAFRILSAVMASHGYSTANDAQQAAPAAAPAAAAVTSTAAATQTAAAAVAVAPPVERCTQVLLPAAPDVEVPEWFFERTGADIRAQWVAMVRSREQQEQFMTRTMREVRRQQLQVQQVAEAAGGGGAGGAAAANVATVRVRFPEGVCLQGHFGASEPVSRVFEWVSEALRSPTLTFELIKPDRRPLTITVTAAATPAGIKAAAAASRLGGPLTVRGADLLPSILLNLRPVGQEAAALTATHVPLMSDAMLRTTKPQ